MFELNFHTKTFFYNEILNEMNGGITPATLTSSIDSFIQAPQIFSGDNTDIALQMALDLLALVRLLPEETEISTILDMR